MPKKIAFSLVRFCRLRLKNKKNERGDPFALISADRTWPYGSSFSSFDCKKSGPISEIVVGRKLATVIVGLFSLEKRRLKIRR